MEKLKLNQPETPKATQGRDGFQTPNYAVDLLIPFIPKGIGLIWEPAAGYGKIVDRLNQHGLYRTVGSDIRRDLRYPIVGGLDFLERGRLIFLNTFDCIITNPPYSLKRRFYKRCMEYKLPFALLIPADYCGWIINAIRFDGAEKIIPTSRIDFITQSHPTNYSRW